MNALIAGHVRNRAIDGRFITCRRMVGRERGADRRRHLADIAGRFPLVIHSTTDPAVAIVTLIDLFLLLLAPFRRLDTTAPALGDPLRHGEAALAEDSQLLECGLRDLH